jgi:hypothetical protein
LPASEGPADPRVHCDFVLADGDLAPANFGIRRTLEEVLAHPSMPRRAPRTSISSLRLPVDASAPADAEARLRWFMFSLSLLENVTSVPSKCSNPVGMAILSAIRAQLGFEEECEGHDAVIAGTDINDDQGGGMFEVGSSFCTTVGIASPASLADLSTSDAAEREAFEEMLSLSWHHDRHRATVLGVALAAAELLHSSKWLQELPPASVARLDQLQAREVKALEQAIKVGSELGLSQASIDLGYTWLRRVSGHA